MKYSVIIVAAGKGTRTGLTYNKVFYKINNEPIICKTLRPFLTDEDCERIVISIAPTEQKDFESLITSPKVVYTFGGATRQESAYLGLAKVESDYVMIHDGVRPFVKKEQIEQLKYALQQDDAALLMVPLIDTIKEVTDGYAIHTPKRENYFAAQTPQAFKTSLIRYCHEEARKHPEIIASDDAMLCEVFSDARIKVIEGSYGNIKITTKKDIQQFEDSKE